MQPFSIFVSDFCINIVTKNNVFVRLEQSEVINFVKAQASLEMECPQRLEIFLFNFRAEIILADRHQISFFIKLDSTISFVLQVPLKEIVCFGEKCRQEVYFNFIARFWGLLEWYCLAYNEHLFVLHMRTNKWSLKQRNFAIHGNKSLLLLFWMRIPSQRDAGQQPQQS